MSSNVITELEWKREALENFLRVVGAARFGAYTGTESPTIKSRTHQKPPIIRQVLTLITEANIIQQFGQYAARLHGGGAGCLEVRAGIVYSLAHAHA